MVFLLYFTRKDGAYNQVIFKIQILFIIDEFQPKWNQTFITLISKVNSPQGVSDYRPIS